MNDVPARGETAESIRRKALEPGAWSLEPD